MDELAKLVDHALITALEKTHLQLIETVHELRALGVTREDILAHWHRVGLPREKHLLMLAIEALMDRR